MDVSEFRTAVYNNLGMITNKNPVYPGHSTTETDLSAKSCRVNVFLPNIASAAKAF